MNIQVFDIDGVIFMTKDIPGIKPYPNDIIITGRSYEEENETREMLAHKHIYNTVYFNTIPYNKKTRESSGLHKGRTLQKLLKEGKKIVCIYEDDEIQIEQIRKFVDIPIVHIKHNLKDKENNRQGEFK